MTSREKAMERLNRATSQWTIESAQKAVERTQKTIDYWQAQSWKYEAKILLPTLIAELEVLNAIVEILTEQAEVEVAAEAVQAVASLVRSFAKATVMRKVVAIAANKLRKLGYSLSDCFKRAWMLVKGAVGFMYVPAPIYSI